MSGRVGTIWPLAPATPPSLAERLDRLLGQRAFGERAWWFAWNETRLQLPGPVHGPEIPNLAGWDVVHVFGQRGELRLWRHDGHFLAAWMAEVEPAAEPPPPLDGWVDGPPARYPYVCRSRRLLLGKPMRLPDAGGQPRPAWGDVSFRELVYPHPAGLERWPPDEGSRLALSVYLYFDARYRLQAVRRTAVEVVEARDLMSDDAPGRPWAGRGRGASS